MKISIHKTNFILNLSLAFLLTVLFGLGANAYGQTCDHFLSANAKTLADFIERENFEPLNIFSNPLEMMISNDPSLNISVNRRAFSYEQELRRGPIIDDQTESRANVRPKFATLASDNKIFGLKYILFDSLNSIEAIKKNYKNIQNMPSGKELLQAKVLLEKNPEYLLILTDAGLSLWTKPLFETWSSEYTRNSLSPNMMKEFIYRTAQDSLYSKAVSSLMAEKASKELDNFQLLESFAKERFFSKSTELEIDSVSFLYRSLFRETLLKQRVELLNQIGKPTKLSTQSSQQLTESLQTLAFFPEFLYQADKISRTKFRSDGFLHEGGLIFKSKVHPLKQDLNLNISVEMWRNVDDLKIENLHMILIINHENSGKKFNFDDYSHVSLLIKDQFKKLQEGLKPNQKVNVEDLNFDIREREDGSGDSVVINLINTRVQNGNESYLMFELFNKLF